MQVGVPITRLTEKYDPTLERWVHGAIDWLLLMPLALCYCLVQRKEQKSLFSLKSLPSEFFKSSFNVTSQPITALLARNAEM